MNAYIAEVVDKMREMDIYTLLVKGQGIAQCYERPLWRTSGDIDFYLSDSNYEKARKYLLPLSSSNKPERVFSKELGMSIEPWYVEIHGTLRTGLSSRLDKEIDSDQREVFYGGSVRSWQNGKTQVFLPGVNEDVFFVFTHFIKHFYKEGGVSIRQLCDWCRLLWTYRDKVDSRLIETRVKKAGLMSEWKAFYALATKYLGMPEVSSLTFNVSGDKKWEKKADRIMEFILMSGNFGHNRDMSYYDKYPYLVRKCISMKMRVGDLCRHARIFPLDSIRFSFWIVLNGLRSAVRGE